MLAFIRNRLINIQLPGYECIVQGRTISASGGLVTLVDQSFQHETVLNVNMHTLWEGLISQIKCGGLPKGQIIGIFTDRLEC